MIARHEAHVVAGAKSRQPLPRERKLGRQTDVENIPCHRDVIGILRLHVLDELRQHGHVVQASPLIPVDIPR